MSYVAVFSGGECAADTDAVVQKLGRPACIIAADSGFERAREFAVRNALKIDLLIGDMDSIPKKSFDEYRENREYREDCAAGGLCGIEKWDCEKDLTDTELALLRAHELSAAHKNCRVVLFGGSGGERAEHFLALIKILHKEYAPHLWFFGMQCVCVLSAHTQRRITLTHCTEHDALSFFCASAGVAHNAAHNSEGVIHAEGLFWSIDSIDWERGDFSLSNKISREYEAQQKPVQITVERGVFFLMSSLHIFLHTNFCDDAA
ncbi:MAG: hypothetical protein Ta2A_23120 [Treponemataceae bacterium]|nr:MAG: hypothetical protein Ta2A_23120 [Treponemataceae bacterium]